MIYAVFFLVTNYFELFLLEWRIAFPSDEFSGLCTKVTDPLSNNCDVTFLRK